MRFAVVFRTVAALLIIFGVALVPPIGVSLWYHDGEVWQLGSTFLAAVGGGLLMWLPLIWRREPIYNRDGFIIVSLSWIVMGLLGSLPFILGLKMGFADSVFESVSGITTTGATVIQGLDHLPRSLLFYRQELQWLGGIGMIVFAIAILPLLGVGGMQLYKAETPGPMKEEKLTPRIANTARALLGLYASLTVACALFYWFAGMSPFDAVAHSMATISTGGFSTHDASLGYFNSPAIEVVATVFMILGAINFGVHFLVWRNGEPAEYWHNAEVRTFVMIVLVIVALVTSWLMLTGTYSSPVESLRFSVFESVSVITSTGFGIADFSVWPLLLPVLLISSSVIGGCAGSTAGGVKVIRFLILGRQVGLEIDRMLHPRIVSALKVNGRIVSERVIQAVWAYFAVYGALFGTFVLVLMAGGLDAVSAFGAVASCVNNLGPGLGVVANNFTAIADSEKWLLALAMLLGRLEIFTILVLFTPAYWRR